MWVSTIMLQFLITDLWYSTLVKLMPLFLHIITSLPFVKIKYYTNSLSIKKAVNITFCYAYFDENYSKFKISQMEI